MEFRPQPAMFVADSAGLDFLNSIATPADEPFDWIANGEGLLDWLAQAGMASGETLAALRARFPAAEFDAVAAQARELREWFREFVRRRKGRPLAASDMRELVPLNALLARDERYGEIVKSAENAGEGAALTYRVARRWRAPDALLMPIAEALAKLVCEEDFTHVKACEGHRCTMLFADHTRGHARRWCSMAVCGNRAKVAAHRQRLKERG